MNLFKKILRNAKSIRSDRSGSVTPVSKAVMPCPNATMKISESTLKKSKATLNRSKATMNRSNATLNRSKATMVRSNATMVRSNATINSAKPTLTKSETTIKNSKATLTKSKATIKKTRLISKSEQAKPHGIGYFVEKARTNNIAIDEFISTADSYFHYSNYILFEISKSATALCLLFVIVDSRGSIAITLLIALNKPGLRSYPGFKDNVKIFEGVIERYCGVPP